MKRTFELLCGTIALLCLFSMFVPLVAPHYSAELYHLASDDSYTKDYYLSGDYYQAREYWSIVKFAQTNNIHRVIIMASMALVLYWCTMSFMGDTSILTGLVASLFNLAVVLYSIIRMVSVAGGSRPFVIVVVVLDSVVAIVCAMMQGMPGKRRYTKPIKIGGKKE